MATIKKEEEDTPAFNAFTSHQEQDRPSDPHIKIEDGAPQVKVEEKSTHSLGIYERPHHDDKHRDWNTTLDVRTEQATSSSTPMIGSKHDLAASAFFSTFWDSGRGSNNQFLTSPSAVQSHPAPLPHVLTEHALAREIALRCIKKEGNITAKPTKVVKAKRQPRKGDKPGPFLQTSTLSRGLPQTASIPDSQLGIGSKEWGMNIHLSSIRKFQCPLVAADPILDQGRPVAEYRAHGDRCSESFSADLASEEKYFIHFRDECRKSIFVCNAPVLSGGHIVDCGKEFDVRKQAQEFVEHVLYGELHHISFFECGIVPKGQTNAVRCTSSLSSSKHGMKKDHPLKAHHDKEHQSLSDEEKLMGALRFIAMWEAQSADYKAICHETEGLPSSMNFRVSSFTFFCLI
ncbi:hypothetical protein BJ508DRAFT_323219 [Ascobolus immersus RN42]|uniref:Uncharacterized protein n=1 Tax=Ascobolus immersus RN42 TaxID=1160509 RepID=A0A3N4IFU6_ASCIM|nr:hypothetical protein BJ508DRAFT_323219 [Ascobolus immersus RN42]